MEPIKVGKGQLMESLTKFLFEEISATEELLDNEKVDEMLHDEDISILTNKITRTVAARELRVCTDKRELKDKAEEIQDRFNVSKFNRIFKHILNARYYGFSLFEKVYDENYNLQSLVLVPQKYVAFDAKKGWYITAGSKETYIDKEKYFLCIHERDVANKKGKSVLKSCLQAYEDKKMFGNQLRGLAKKYGETIIFFAYDDTEDENDVKKKAEEVKKMQGGGTVIGVPTSLGMKLSDSLYLLDLKDIDPSIYIKLHDWKKEKLTQNLLGGTLTIDNGQGRGSYGLGEIHQQSFDEVVNDCCQFITDNMQQLLYFDSLYFGYDYREFYFKLEKIKDRDEELAFDEKQEDLKAKRIDNFLKMREAGITEEDLNGDEA